MRTLLREFWLFLREEKKWWLVPLLVVVGIVAVLVILGALSPGFAPFLYTLI